VYTLSLADACVVALAVLTARCATIRRVRSKLNMPA
jgi:hypothetical protein